MMVFPYCVGDSGQPKPTEDKSKFQWLNHRLGDDKEPWYILDGLKEAKEGLVYGTRLRALGPPDSKGNRHGLSESVVLPPKWVQEPSAD